MFYHGNQLVVIIYITHTKDKIMKNLNDVVVERLCKYMGEKDLTQYKLAQLSGVPFPTIKSIMQRRTKGISLKTIIERNRK